MTRRIPENNADEIALLFVAVAAELRRFASKLAQGDYASADDLVQEVFHDAAFQWESLRNCDIDRQRAWLFSVLKNKSIDRWKADQRVNVSLDLAPPHSDRDDTHNKALNAIILERCWMTISKMPAIRHRVAYLRWHDDWSTAEIACLLGIDQSTVRGHLKRARDELVRGVGANVVFIADSEMCDQQGEEAAS